LEAMPLPDGMPLRRPSMHLLRCATPCSNVHVRLETWTVDQLNRCGIHQWEVDAATSWLKKGGAPGEDDVCDKL
jgi:hypothetical protein